MTPRPITLAEHQQILYKILYMIDDFCTEHHIHYFLVGGSALGAVRHHGIIPWDDDIDIGMERTEYGRFVTLFRQNLPKGYCLLTMDNTPGYTLPFAKVGRLGTLQHEVSKNVPSVGIPINIDILPQDGCPGDTREEAINYFEEKRALIQGLIWWRYNEPVSLRPSLWRNSLRVLRYRLHYPSLKSVKSVYDSARRYTVRDCKFYACLANGLYGRGEVQSVSSIMGEPLRMPFGEREIPIPRLWHAYLTDLYGDYMTPPPVEKRKRHADDGHSYLLED